MLEPAPIRELMQRWDQDAWCLAALSFALRPAGELSAAALEVMAALGLPDEPDGLIDGVALRPGQLDAQAAAPLIQLASLLRNGSVGWDNQPDEALLAQGRTSAMTAATFEQLAPAVLDGMSERLNEPGVRMLDVGTGVASLAIALAEVYPNLHVVGIDVMGRVLALAERARAESSVGDRVEIREQDVAELDEPDSFDLAWIPAAFVPETSLRPGVEAVATSLRPGGWLMLGHGRFGDDELHDALSRFKALAYGGTALDEKDASTMLTESGLVDIHCMPGPPGSSSISVGRRPPD